MPLFDQEDMDIRQIPGTGNMSYSAIRAVDVENVGASCITLVTIAIDRSGSVCSFASVLTDMLKVIIDGCKRDQYAESIMVRVILFNKYLKEVHGFLLLTSIDVNQYEKITTGGTTALNDAVFSSVGATLDFAKTLTNRDLEVASINFIITDGEENDSTVKEAAVRDRIYSAIQSEELDSITNILIQLNDPNNPKPSTVRALKKFKDKVGITKFLDFGDATPENVASLAEFVIKSTSSTSASVNSGTPVDLNI